ncbi:MAG TPA: APC family permease [Gemmatimonadales bacterium]|nr:APC family permease [Gemmatimonadales bacterium]
MTRDSQLIRALGIPAFTLAIVNTIVGSGIFGLPAAAAQVMGSAAPLAYVGCSILVGLVALCFAECGSRVPHTGGTYAWARTAFGPQVGSSVGYLMAFANLAGSNAAVGALLVASLRAALPSLPLWGPGIIVAIIYITLALTNIRGVKSGARVSMAMALIKVTPLLVLVGAGLFALNRENLRIPQAPSAGTLASGMVLLFFAFMGTEGPLSTIGEVKNPTRTIPRALGLAVLLTGTLYLLVHVVAESALGPRLAEVTDAPLAEAAGVIFGPTGRTFLLWAAILSTTGYFTGDILSAPRMFNALGEDGLLPRWLGKVHPEYHTPHVAIVFYVAFCGVLAVTGTFRQLAIFASAGTLLVYAISVLGLLRLRKLGVQGDSEPFRAPGGVLLPAICTIIIAGLLWSLRWQEQVAAFGLAIVGAIPGYLTTRREP